MLNFYTGKSFLFCTSWLNFLLVCCFFQFYLRLIRLLAICLNLEHDNITACFFYRISEKDRRKATVGEGNSAPTQLPHRGAKRAKPLVINPAYTGLQLTYIYLKWVCMGMFARKLVQFCSSVTIPLVT